VSFKSCLIEIKKQYFIFSIIYFLVSALEITGDFLGSKELVYMTKPLLMPLLIVLYYSTWKKQKDFISKLLIGALFFAFIGDVALMLLSLNEQFFLIGLGAFMITQLLYIIVFSKVSFPKKKVLQPNRLLILLLFVLFYILLMNILYDQLKDLLIPVLVYGAVVCFMGYVATMRNVNLLSYLLVLFGACLFIISDSLIAINKFIFSSELIFVQPSIMLLYIAGQYFIVSGMIKAYKE